MRRLYRAIDSLHRPPVQLWGAPGTPVTAWLIGHFTVLIVVWLFATREPVTDTTSSATADVLAIASAVIWSILVSALPAAVTVRLLRSALPAYEPSHRWRSVSALGSGRVLITVTALAIVAAPVGVVSLTTGGALVLMVMRRVGLGAWAGARLPPGLAVTAAVRTARSVLLPTALTVGGAAVGIAGLTAGATAVGIGWGTDPTTAATAKLAAVAIGIGAAIAPAIIAAEGIGAIARYDRQRHQLLRRAERDRVQREFNSRLHDRALGLLSAARMYPADHPNHDLALDALGRSLRELLYENEQTAEGRPLHSWMHHVEKHRAVDLGLDLAPVCDLRHHGLLLDNEAVQLLDLTIDTLLSNSVKAGATTARLRASMTDGRPDRLHFDYTDNGPGFDPATALARGGGLANAYRRLTAGGGAMEVVREPGATVVQWWLPRQAPEQSDRTAGNPVQSPSLPA